MMRWKRSELTKEKRAWTPLRLRAAERAVQRQRDAVPLFPEMVADKTVEERRARMDQRENNITTRLRAFKAGQWHEARRCFRSMTDESRRSFLLKWNHGPYPADGTSALTVMRMMGLL